MTDPRTFTAEHKSWQWELVLRYEDGTMPASEWNESTLAVVADWYAKNLTREQATTRIHGALPQEPSPPHASSRWRVRGDGSNRKGRRSVGVAAGQGAGTGEVSSPPPQAVGSTVANAT
jgi:hypothetical protein